MLACRPIRLELTPRDIRLTTGRDTRTADTDMARGYTNNATTIVARLGYTATTKAVDGVTSA